MSGTCILSSYISKLEFNDPPPVVVEKAKVTILDAISNMIVEYPLGPTKMFLELSKEMATMATENLIVGLNSQIPPNCVNLKAKGASQ